MRSARKKIVYLQRLIQRTDTASVMQSVSGIYFAHDVAHKPAAYQPRELPVIGSSSVRKGLDSGKWHAAFLVPVSKFLRNMKRNAKTAGETATTITFMADWLDFTDHLTNAQFGRLARCVARFERGDITTAHVAELRKDAAVGVAYNFITDQLSRRTQQ